MHFSTRRTTSGSTRSVTTASGPRLVGGGHTRNNQRETRAARSPNSYGELSGNEADRGAKQGEGAIFNDITSRLESIHEDDPIEIIAQQLSLETHGSDTVIEEYEQESTVQPTDRQVNGPRRDISTAEPALEPANRSRAQTSQSWLEDRIARAATSSRYNASHMSRGRSRMSFPRSAHTDANMISGAAVKEQLREGVLVWHMETVECFSEQQTHFGDEVFSFKDGQRYFRKGRFWCIESVHEHHFVELPICTYNHKGITEKPEAFGLEHVGIRPLHISVGEYHQQNSHRPLEVDRMRNRWEKLDVMSVLHFTKPRPASLDTNVRVVGALTGESMARVRKLLADFGC